MTSAVGTGEAGTSSTSARVVVSVAAGEAAAGEVRTEVACEGVKSGRETDEG